MRVVEKNEFLLYKDSFIKEINEGRLFIDPTDTIYGLGCDATNEKAVKKIRQAKERNTRPFSVIAPSKEWIKENCVVNDEVLDNLPGQVTLILPLQNKEAVAQSVNNGMNSLGVRMPDHWISDVVREIGKPIVTTSVNKIGEDFTRRVDNIHRHIKAKVSFAISEGILKGRPSKIINLLSDEVIER